MATLINPCNISEGSVSNTGVECSAALGIAKGIFIMHPSYTWTAEDMADPVAFITARIHAAGSSRFYPVLQGIFDFAIANESDITETNPITGINSRLRAGGFTLTYTFEEGGLCLAKALLGFQGKGYRFIAVDQDSKMLVRLNSDGTYSGLKSSDISSSIIPASASAKFKNTLILGVSQDEYIRHSELIQSSEDITDFNGLIDTEITKAAEATIISVATSATRDITLTTLGADGDTVNVRKTGSVTISGGVVTKTSSETTLTLMATKIKNAINTATSTNGGYTATSTGAIITLIAPISVGSSLNGENIAPLFTGTFAGSFGVFAGGVNASGKLKIGVRTECAHTDLVDTYGADIALAALYVVTDTADDSTITPTGVAVVGGVVEITAPIIAGHTYNVVGSAPSVWLTNSVSGYDASGNGVDIVVS
jgi:hypothetical protein